MNNKNRILKIIKELSKYDLLLSNPRIGLTINYFNKVNLIKFDKTSIDIIKDIINNEEEIKSFNLSLELVDTDEKYREEYPSNWYRSTLIFHGSNKIYGKMDFISENINYGSGKRDCSINLVTEDDIINHIFNIIDLHKIYVSTNNTLSIKFENVFKIKN